MELVEHVQSELKRIYGGKRWIVAHDILIGAGWMATGLQLVGAEGALCIGASRGAGDLPDPEFAPTQINLNVKAPDMMSAIRVSLDALANVDGDVQAQVDAYDPDGELRVLGTIFDDGRDVAGRRKFGARPASWRALEDKVAIDAVWDTCGIPRAPSRNVRLDDLAGLEAASNELDLGDGVVWAADAREGFHGGATFTRWVPTPELRETTRELFSAHADSVRVMPFLEGIPCSIHGIVFEGYVVALRPCEMVVLRRPDHSFQYAKAATYWDPDPADREEMRATAKRVGAHLRKTVGYRGAFTIDGVMTRDGFRPTELNPRFGAALGVMTGGVGIDMVLFNLAVVEGVDADWKPRELEQVLLDHADQRRSAGANAVVKKKIDEGERVELAYDGEFRLAAEGDEVAATVVLGPNPAGGIVLVKYTPGAFETGPPFAPVTASLLQWADAHWGLGIGRLEPAQQVR